MTAIAIFAAASLSACAGCGPVRQNGSPDAAPAEAMTYRGTEDLASGRFGVLGGALVLSGGPTLSIPPGQDTGQGLTVFLRREAAGSAAKGAAVGATYLESPPLLSAGDGRFTFSLDVARLPDGCDESRLALAFERPGTVGPADGAHSAAVEWAYEPARRDGVRVSAALARLTGMHLQFVCREAP